MMGCDISFARLLASVSICLLLSSCEYYNKRLNPNIYDSDTGLSREEYKDAITQKQAKSLASRNEAAIPPMHPITFIPPINNLPETKRVSISVTQDIPLKEVLFELSRKSGLNFKLDSNIEGGINFTAYNEPFIKVIEGITRTAGLRYRFEGNFLKIEQDTPYFINYQVNFLNLLRRGSSQTSISTDVFSGSFGQEGGGSAADNGSNSLVESTSDADFWLVVESNIAKMLNDASGGAEDPLSTVLGIPGQEAVRERAGISTTSRVGPYSRITSNRQAGLVSVFATEGEHRRVLDFLNTLRERVNSQVTVEAKILEVTLNDDYRNGINWQTLFDVGAATVSARARFDSPVLNNPIQNFEDSTNNDVAVGVRTGDFSGVISAVESFGSTRTLSSPRVTIINNQPAIMKVAENQVFFQLEFERVEGTLDEADRTNTSSKILTVPVGLVMALQPAIDKANQKIMLNLRPTISRIQSFVDDPAVSIASNNQVKSSIPVVEVREIDSVVHMDSGQVVLMGGLMQERSRNQDQGVPFISRIPGFNLLFGTREQEKEVVELVILLKAEIVDNGGVTDHDRALYERFINDPRPIEF